MKRVILFLTFLMVLIGTGCVKRTENQQVTVCFAGDLLLDRGIAKQLERQGFYPLLKECLPLFTRSDFVLVNLECPVTEVNKPEWKRYVFRGDPKWLPQLKASGITHVSLANNHTYDHGQAGFIGSLKNLNQTGIGVAGIHDGDEYCQPLVLQKGVVRIAVFAFNQIETGSIRTNPRLPVRCDESFDQVCRHIEKWKSEHPGDAIVAFPHWGEEYQTNPTPAQQLQARQLIDAGAEAVIGHHPHVVQQRETYKGKPIYYSVGNFLFDQDDPATLEEWIVELTFSQQGLEQANHHRFLRNPFFGLDSLREDDTGELLP